MSAILRPLCPASVSDFIVARQPQALMSCINFGFYVLATRMEMSITQYSYTMTTFICQLLTAIRSNKMTGIPRHSHCLTLLHKIQMCIEFIDCIVIHRLKHICICIECNVYVCMTKPGLKNYGRDS